MKRILLAGLFVLILFVLATSPVVKRWTGHDPASTSMSSLPDIARSIPIASQAIPVKCDGRKYCSQMTSCAEAKAFLQQCPGTEMDGDHDGIPCESQWCE